MVEVAKKWDLFITDSESGWVDIEIEKAKEIDATVIRGNGFDHYFDFPLGNFGIRPGRGGGCNLFQPSAPEGQKTLPPKLNRRRGNS